MALVEGNTGYWTSGGVTYSGTVHLTPLLHTNGSPNQDGGEPFYSFVSVSPVGGLVTSTTVVKVRATEVRASA
jgi:hypothetical protein